MSKSVNGQCRGCGHGFKLIIAKDNECRMVRCDTCGEEHKIFSGSIMRIINGNIKCNCGGILRKDAPARCPYCYSESVIEGEQGVPLELMYILKEPKLEMDLSHTQRQAA